MRNLTIAVIISFFLGVGACFLTQSSRISSLQARNTQVRNSCLQALATSDKLWHNYQTEIQTLGSCMAAGSKCDINKTIQTMQAQESERKMLNNAVGIASKEIVKNVNQ